MTVPDFSACPLTSSALASSNVPNAPGGSPPTPRPATLTPFPTKPLPTCPSSSAVKAWSASQWTCSTTPQLHGNAAAAVDARTQAHPTRRRQTQRRNRFVHAGRITERQGEGRGSIAYHFWGISRPRYGIDHRRGHGEMAGLGRSERVCPYHRVTTRQKHCSPSWFLATRGMR